jgi:hypothetical protein
MTVPYTTNETEFIPQPPRPWSPVPFANRPRQNPIGMHPDGRQMIVAPTSRVDHLAIMLDVFAELERLVPTK